VFLWHAVEPAAVDDPEDDASPKKNGSGSPRIHAGAGNGTPQFAEHSRTREPGRHCGGSGGMSLRGARWLAVPLAMFLLVFGASFAYHSLVGDWGAPAAGRSPAPISEGGERIVVTVREGEGEGYLWVVGVDGSNPVQITHAPSSETTAVDAAPAWSPDGALIVFSRQVVHVNGRPSRPYLYTVAPDGSGLRQLTRGDAFDFGADWSPDGSRILFGRLVGETSTDLFTVQPDGSGLLRLTDNPRTHEERPAYSPDGKRIAYTAVLADEDLWVMNADGSEQKLLLGGRPPDGSPAWSPDGRQIAFVHSGRIAVMGSDGSKVRVLGSGPRGSHPQWSPDGSRILFTGDPDGIFVMNADGSGLERVPIQGLAEGARWEPAE
jgi:Tol biopolymer transport system component